MIKTFQEEETPAAEGKSKRKEKLAVKGAQMVPSQRHTAESAEKSVHVRSYRWPLCYPLQSPTLLVFPQDQEHQRGHQTCPCSARHHVRPSASTGWGEPGLSPPLPKLSQSLFPLSLQWSCKTSVCSKPVLLCETSEPWRQPQTSPPNPG